MSMQNVITAMVETVVRKKAEAIIQKSIADLFRNDGFTNHLEGFVDRKLKEALNNQFDFRQAAADIIDDEVRKLNLDNMVTEAIEQSLEDDVDIEGEADTAIDKELEKKLDLEDLVRSKLYDEIEVLVDGMFEEEPTPPPAAKPVEEAGAVATIDKIIDQIGL